MMVQRPTLTLAGEDLEALELICSGLLGPVTGYRLPSDSRPGWPVAPSLGVSSSLAERVVEAGALELRDPDTTPLAVLTIEACQPADTDLSWLAGDLEPIRQPEHGPARLRRLSRTVDLAGHLVAVFSGEVRPVDVLRIASEQGGRAIALVAEGTNDPTESTRLLGTLEECAHELRGATVFYVPGVRIGDPGTIDITRLVLESRGVSEFVDLRRPAAKVDRQGGVVLFTGLSGAGKSTIARAVTDHLRLHSEQRVVLLDGDHVRAELASELTFSAEDRDRNLQRQAWVGARVAEAGGIAICAPIAPFASSRSAMRAKVEPDFRFLLVYVSTPIAVAEERDRKGLYAKARAGLIPDFTGVGSPYEQPEDADLTIDTSVHTVEECVDDVVALLRREGWMSDS